MHHFFYYFEVLANGMYSAKLCVGIQISEVITEPGLLCHRAHRCQENVPSKNLESECIGNAETEVCF